MSDGTPAKWRGGLEDILGYEQFTWKKRLVAMFEFITEEDKIILDLGAGNMHLRGLLKKEVVYIPVDYKKNAKDTVVCDFNRYEFPDIQADVVVAAGILGYMKDPLWFLGRICHSCKKCIISHKGKEEYPAALLYSDEVIKCMKKYGFALTGQNTSLKEEWSLIACFEKINPGKLRKQVNCTGCGACSNACTRDAIEMKMDDEGFLKPCWDKSKCIDCGHCLNVCPVLAKSDDKEETCAEDIGAYAVWAKDSVRKGSSSGGVFYMLASQILRKGGYVFGGKWNLDFGCDIDYVDDIQTLHLLMHSKYVQSNTRKSFRTVKKFLADNLPVLYVGCPCQIAGLKQYLGDDFRHPCLYSVDLVCFGVPSERAFQKYLTENYKKEDIADIVFRDKNSGEGWSPTGYSISFQNGHIEYPKIEEDRYQQAFHKVLFRNEVCEECRYYKLPRLGDFTLGDFWGIDIHDPTWNDGRGTSLVLTNTKKAKKLFKEMESAFKRVQPVPLEWCKDKGNRVITNARPGHLNRRYFFDLLKTQKSSFNNSVDKALTNKHDIGLVCRMNCDIGNNLTNYALYKYLSRLGYRVLMIDAPFTESKSPMHNEKQKLYYFLKNPYNSFDILNVRNKWEAFEKVDVCDMYVVGSDGLWLDEVIKGTDYFTLLDWVPSYIHKISYGTSIGTGNVAAEESEKSRIRYLLNRFQKISLQEEVGRKYFEDYWKISSLAVLDPVFLCPRSYFDKFADLGALRTIQDKYVAAYFLKISCDKEACAIRIAEKVTSGKYMAMTEPVCLKAESAGLEYTYEPGIEEWVSMIKNSEFVVTDSFYGMCFALIFEKPFYVVSEKNDSRFNLLTQLAIPTRKISGLHDLEMISSNIMMDYGEVNIRLAKLRDESGNWLRQALDKRDVYYDGKDEYDFHLELKYEQIKYEKVRIESARQIRSELFLQKQLLRKTANSREKGRKDMTIVGWGAGRCFRNNLEKLQKYCVMNFVCDRNPDLWGTSLTKDIVCISPAELMKMGNVVVLIMIEDAAAAISIANQLADMGISNYEHIYNWLFDIERGQD